MALADDPRSSDRNMNLPNIVGNRKLRLPSIVGSIVSSLSLCLFLVSTTSASPPAPVYTVRKGDTPIAIAQRFGVDVDRLLEANRVSDPRSLQIGQKLVIPRSQPVETPPAPAAEAAPASESVPAPPPAEAAPAGSPEGADAVSAEIHQRSEQVLAIARTLLGVPYRFGGSSPKGFDCSGFVRYVLRQVGIDAPHNALGMYRLVNPIEKDQVHPGDLVFFVNTYMPGISHVGIYVGAGKFIHSPYRGRGVQFESLSNPYYAARYYAAGRP